MRNLDWNMLNEVYVFGYFHADLHPANLFVLPGDAIGYVDFGIVGQLPQEVRDSLTRYSWLLFRGDIEAAIVELMRWLSPTSTTDARRRPGSSHGPMKRSSTRWARPTSSPAGSIPPGPPPRRLARRARTRTRASPWTPCVGSATTR